MEITLRERTESHVRTYFRRTADSEIRSGLPQLAQTEAEAVAAFYGTLEPGAASFGRTIYRGEAYVGDVWCYCMNPAETPNAMVSYCVFEKALWGRGIATAALGQFMKLTAEKFGLESLGAFTYLDNAASRAVLEKNGFTCRETFPEDGRESAYYQIEMEKNCG